MPAERFVVPKEAKRISKVESNMGHTYSMEGFHHGKQYNWKSEFVAGDFGKITCHLEMTPETRRVRIELENEGGNLVKEIEFNTLRDLQKKIKETGLDDHDFIKRIQPLWIQEKKSRGVSAHHLYGETPVFNLVKETIGNLTHTVSFEAMGKIAEKAKENGIGVDISDQRAILAGMSASWSPGDGDLGTIKQKLQKICDSVTEDLHPVKGRVTLDLLAKAGQYIIHTGPIDPLSIVRFYDEK